MFNVVVEWLDEKKSRARFSLPGRYEWSAQNIDDLIRVLAEIRQEMSPAVPEHPPGTAGAEPLHAPRYATELHQFSGGTLFEFRHPALGWLEFLLPSAERTRISRILAEQESAWQRYRG
jgi:hypothetical protein